MIRIQQIKCKPGHSRKELEERICKALSIRTEQIASVSIVKESIDARKKPDIRLIYTVDVSVEGISEEKLLRRNKDRNITKSVRSRYRFPSPGEETPKGRPVIVGMGPAGLFCGYMLAQAGYRPLLLERGEDVDQRTKTVEAFWTGGSCDPDSNVQFGEGGAGTFSDGKLNTLVRDKEGRNGQVLRILAEHGAPERILYESKPHIGTDILSQVVKSMRQQILGWGGEVRFRTRVTDLILEGNRVKGVICADGERIEAGQVVLAVGHSARDTFEMLLRRGIPMEAKAFAVGLRVEHPQELINLSQYGQAHPDFLPPASYKLTAQTAENRGVYSFCMCPGGYVVNASSEPGRLAVNGMSYSKRDGRNANSAIIVSVTPADYGANGPLSGVTFQRRLEEKAFRLANGAIPMQRYGEFAADAGRLKREGHVPATMQPAVKGAFAQVDLRGLLPPSVERAFVEGMESFDRMIPGFADDAVTLLGVESRTSSPVRITRDEAFLSDCDGLYPCGEGAGYAGGITSAAMDGMKIAEAIARRYKTL